MVKEEDRVGGVTSRVNGTRVGKKAKRAKVKPATTLVKTLAPAEQVDVLKLTKKWCPNRSRNIKLWDEKGQG